MWHETMIGIMAQPVPNGNDWYTRRQMHRTLMWMLDYDR
jgi:hypothetical protein